DADDERVMTFDCAFVQCTTQTSHLTTTIRGLDGKVLRVYNFDFGQPWGWVRDYVYRDGQLLASVEPDGGGGEAMSHFHLDHLGSPRQITDGGAVETAFHTYYPFGGDATDPGQDEVALKFTGHERDTNGSGGAGALDYMHARYCAPGIGRFLSADPAVLRISTKTPYRWNRYSYANNNPVKFLDPNGKTAVVFIVSPSYEQASTSFGHAAILATSGNQRASASEGTPIQLTPRVSDFVNAYLAQERLVKAFVLKEDAGRDKRLMTALDPAKRKSYRERRQNCATACGDALREAGVIGANERPERGMLYDSPARLQEALESGALSRYVEAEIVFDPRNVQEVQPGQIVLYFKFDDSLDFVD
ncbi:MAG: RHS repeat-associated core domain-containing protein, partial [bacterium]|nr:RHS repeat-associated core domain-containing protein [bacterium]